MIRASDDLDAIVASLRADIETLAETLIGEPSERSLRQWRWGGKGSFSLEIAGAKRGAWCSHESGQGGGPLQLIQFARQCSIADAINWGKMWLGRGGAEELPAFPAPTSPVLSSSINDTGPMIARRIWLDAAPATGTLVERYLASRGLSLPDDAPIRFHPACPREREKLPAMVALMTDPGTSEPVGVHRTYLAHDGSGKAAGKSRMMLGGAGVIRLVPSENVTMGLGIAEGIETSLSIMQHFEWRPVWAATSAGLMGSFPVLGGIESLTLFADADANGAGMAAAEKCCARWRSAGREVTITIPSAGDFNDLARRSAS